MVKCVFCGREEYSFKGIHLIKNDGSVNFFCSSKCKKNAIKLKRDKKKLKWTNFNRIMIAEEKQKVIDRANKAATLASTKVKEAKEVEKTEKTESKKTKAK